MAGKKMGRLLITSKYEFRGQNKRKLFFLCECDCGASLWIHSYALKKGRKSCGCVKVLGKYKKDYGLAMFNNVLSSYINSAENRSLDWNLTVEHVKSIMESDCHYCGSPPSNVRKSNSDNGDFIYNGIDRKDSRIGYTIDNCVAACSACNYAKGSLTYLQFLSLIARVYLNRVMGKTSVKFGQYSEDLCIANLKLFKVCDLKDKIAKGEIECSNEQKELLLKQDIELCKTRAHLKSELDKIIMGYKAIFEAKNYG
jgi:hypothetical protein